MLKNVMLALVPLTMLASSVKADDDLNIDVASIADAEVSIVVADLDIDVDQLSADAGTEDGDDAIEACFRRFGYRGYRGYRGHRGYRGFCGYRSYGYYNYCRPLYSYRTICYAPPVYRCVVTPIYHYYWGCR
ncbi:MAG: hypothetical protein ABGZ24_21550 [Fuerstiella sp.]